MPQQPIRINSTVFSCNFLCPVGGFTNSTSVSNDKLNHDSHPGRELADANGEKLVIDSLWCRGL